MLDVHIALVGTKAKPILEGLQMYKTIDRIYLLHSIQTKKIAKIIERKIKQVTAVEILFDIIDPFSLESVINSIIGIGNKEKSNNIFINITGGTNIMAGSACAASFFLGAQAYYILDTRKSEYFESKKNLLLELPIPKIPYYLSLEPMQRKILRLIARRDTCDVAYLKQKVNLSPQSISYHIKMLGKKKLISIERTTSDPRKLKLKITNPGSLLARWTD